MPVPSSATTTSRQAAGPVERDTHTSPVVPGSNACASALCTSSVSTSTSGVASAAGSVPKLPSRRTLARDSAVAPSPIAGSTVSTSSSRSTRSATEPDSDSCTSAIEFTRRTLSASARRASGIAVRRACSRSRAATVCRLFFTRWWISRIVASLLQQGQVAAAQVGDVADQHQRAGRVAPRAAAAARARASTAPRAAHLHPQRVPPVERRLDPGGHLGGVERVAAPAPRVASASDSPTRSLAWPIRW